MLLFFLELIFNFFFFFREGAGEAEGEGEKESRANSLLSMGPVAGAENPKVMT